MNNLAIKIDVDTLRGYREGMPRMLTLLKKHGIQASIFFSFGPDNSGKAIRRIFRKGFISKMLRTKAPSTYGLKTLFYGTLLPAPMIAASDPDIFKRAFHDGHDCGVHAWDHVLTQDKLQPMSENDFELLYNKAAAMFEKISGCQPSCYAAPGWQVSEASLAAQERLKLKYASDTRGYSPFMPEYKSRRFSVPQIPTTLPTMDEILGADGVTDESLPDVWIGLLNVEWNVLTVHAEMEGLSKLGVFENFLLRAKADGFRFMTLREVAEKADMTPEEIIVGELPGRAGGVALQARGMIV
ncbi:polysaccharide deacetylase [Synergistales bacterium]|nr:polysaccharide deacetylase [Synergistales bacterium]